MFNSFSSALSALRAHSQAVDTVGNNLANVNTTGFKSSDVAFKDIVAESMGSGSETGMGVTRPFNVRHFSQGAIQTTSGALDAAIQGNGFFVIRDPANTNGSPLLTRDGSFKLDDKGFVTTLTGESVLGYRIDPTTGQPMGGMVPIQIVAGPSGATATSNITTSINLNSSTDVGGTFSSPVEVYDSLGNKHTLTVTFTKTADNAWDWDLTIPAVEVGGAVGDPPESLVNGSLTFDTNGNLLTPDDTAAPENIATTGLVGGAAELDIDWSFWSNGLGTITQFSQASSTMPGTRDGGPSGEVKGVGLGEGGKVIVQYTNGTEKALYQLAVALVGNPESLAAVGNNAFRATMENSEPTYGVAEAGGRGKVKANALEASTVDIAREFTNLIVYQRGYQANSRVITAADELSQETLNLKR